MHYFNSTNRYLYINLTNPLLVIPQTNLQIDEIDDWQNWRSQQEQKPSLLGLCLARRKKAKPIDASICKFYLFTFLPFYHFTLNVFSSWFTMICKTKDSKEVAIFTLSFSHFFIPAKRISFPHSFIFSFQRSAFPPIFWCHMVIFWGVMPHFSHKKHRKHR